MGYLHTIAVENTNANGLDMLVEKMTRVEMEAQVVAEKSLYEMFDEQRLLNGEYSDESMREVIQRWIEAGDECASCA
jgi:hypothetical protein